MRDNLHFFWVINEICRIERERERERESQNREFDYVSLRCRKLTHIFACYYSGSVAIGNSRSSVLALAPPLKYLKGIW